MPRSRARSVILYVIALLMLVLGVAGTVELVLRFAKQFGLVAGDWRDHSGASPLNLLLMGFGFSLALRRRWTHYATCLLAWSFILVFVLVSIVAALRAEWLSTLMALVTVGCFYGLFWFLDRPDTRRLFGAQAPTGDGSTDTT